MCTSRRRVSGWATEDGLKLYCDTEPLALCWAMTFSPSEMPFLKFLSWLHTFPLLVDTESETAYMLHAVAHSKRPRSWHPLHHMRRPCSYARRLGLVEFKGNVVGRELYASVLASCCVNRLHFSGADCVYAICSLRIHYSNTRIVWECGRKNSSQSDYNCNNYLDYLKSLGLFYIRKTSHLQLRSLCIL